MRFRSKLREFHLAGGGEDALLLYELRQMLGHGALVDRCRHVPHMRVRELSRRGYM